VGSNRQQGLEKRHDVQATEGAEESLTILPDYIHHRTSPAQALLTILTETCCNV
jgi:hypothetical protein